MGAAIGAVVGGLGGAGGLMGMINQIFPIKDILSNVGKMIGQGIGKGVQDAAKNLVQEHGMPKFVGEAVKKAVEEVLGKQGKSPAELGEAAGKQYANDVKDFQEAFTKSFIKNTVENMDCKKKKGSGSWYEAMAEALGKAVNDQAKQVEELSGKITSDSAKDDPKGMTDLQSAQQRMQFMMSSVDQVLKGVGEALKQLASRN